MTVVSYAILGLLLHSYLSYMIDGYVNSPDTAEVQVYLNSGMGPEEHSLVDSRNYFFFDKLSPGSYKLTLSSPEYVFPSYSIDISSEEGVTVFEVDAEQKERRPDRLPLQVSPKRKVVYFDKREPFNLNNFLKSPYGIMISITVGLMICMKQMPKMEDLQAAEQVRR